MVSFLSISERINPTYNHISNFSFLGDMVLAMNLELMEKITYKNNDQLFICLFFLIDESHFLLQLRVPWSFDRFTTKILIHEVFIKSAGHNLMKQSLLTNQMCKKKDSC